MLKAAKETNNEADLALKYHLNVFVVQGQDLGMIDTLWKLFSPSTVENVQKAFVGVYFRASAT